ncbi:hypothetical protein Tco_0556740 [Tanacetum coccineum]
MQSLREEDGTSEIVDPQDCLGSLELEILDSTILTLLLEPTDFVAFGLLLSRSTEPSDGLAAIQAQLNNLGREIKKVNEKVYAAQIGCEQWGYEQQSFGIYPRKQCESFFTKNNAIYGDTLSKFYEMIQQRDHGRKPPI